MTELCEIPIIRIKPEAWRRLRNGHRWVFANELETAVSELPVGGIIQIIGNDGKHFGYAHANPRTLIAARILTYSTNPPGREWLFSRLDAAYRMREQLGFGNVYRLVFSEADSLPGLIIDRYDEHFVIQILTAGMEFWRSHIVDWLRKQFHPQSLHFRNDSPYRIQEGLSAENVTMIGEPPDRFRWETDGVIQLANLKSGQKTGSFLDQRINRTAIDPYVTPNSIVLD
ncbi:MAG: hypothetical protein OEM52_11055, partial [bacterium]|nr:hypothetical protein [bacterium]